MTNREYWERSHKIQDWKDKKLDQALSWLCIERDKLDDYKRPETKALCIALATDLQNRYNAICQSIEKKWMGMIWELDKHSRKPVAP